MLETKRDISPSSGLVLRSFLGHFTQVPSGKFLALRALNVCIFTGNCLLRNEYWFSFNCLSVSCIRSHYWTPLCILEWSQIESKLSYSPYLYNTRGSSWTLYCPRATDINFLQTKQSKETVNLWESIKWSSKRNVWIFYQNFLTNCFRKCIEIHMLENL